MKEERKNVKDLFTKKVVFENVSDVIYQVDFYSEEFMNIMTQKRSKDGFETLQRKGIHYMVITSECDALDGRDVLRGLYAEYSEEYDAIAIYEAMMLLPNHYRRSGGVWKRTTRAGVFTRNGFFATKGFVERLQEYAYVDICSWCETAEDSTYKNFHHSKINKLLYEYYGGVYNRRAELFNFEVLHLSFYNLFKVMGRRSCEERAWDFYNKDDYHVGMKEFLKRDDVALKEVPTNLTNRVGKMLKSKLNYCLKYGGSLLNTMKKNSMSFAYLQKAEGCYVLRIFHAIATGSIEDVKALKNINIYESSRVYLYDDENPFEKVPAEYFTFPLLYYDKEGIEESKFKYIGDIFTNSNNHAKKQISNPCCTRMHNCFLYVALLAYYPLLEKLKRAGMDKLYRELMSFLYTDASGNYNILNVTIRLSHYIGKINWNAKKINQILCVPKSMLEDRILQYTALPVTILEVIRDTKSIFSSCPEYLERMNEEDVKSLVRGISYISRSSTCLEILEKLITIYGPQNHKEYLEYVRKGMGTRLISSSYVAYLEQVQALSEISLMETWKFKSAEELERALISAQRASLVLKDKSEYAAASKKIEGRLPELEPYEYSDNEYEVMVPKRPSDLILEGIELNHCVKTFINEYANGNTTILFIRKKTNPDKPFFTMEVLDGEIRQCHGANNSNMDSVVGLEQFVKKWCETKNIRFHYGDRALAVAD